MLPKNKSLGCCTMSSLAKAQEKGKAAEEDASRTVVRSGLLRNSHEEEKSSTTTSRFLTYEQVLSDTGQLLCPTTPERRSKSSSTSRFHRLSCCSSEASDTDSVVIMADSKPSAKGHLLSSLKRASDFPSNPNLLSATSTSSLAAAASGGRQSAASARPVTPGSLSVGGGAASVGTGGRPGSAASGRTTPGGGKPFSI